MAGGENRTIERADGMASGENGTIERADGVEPTGMKPAGGENGTMERADGVEPTEKRGTQTAIGGTAECK